METKNKKRFLDRFTKNQRSTVKNDFLKVIRDGETDPQLILVEVIKNTIEKREWIFNNMTGNEEEVFDFIDDCFAWENMSEQEKAEAKKQSEQSGINEWMKNQKLTPMQIFFLKKYNKGVLPENRYEASVLIDKLKKEKGF